MHSSEDYSIQVIISLACIPLLMHYMYTAITLRSKLLAITVRQNWRFRHNLRLFHNRQLGESAARPMYKVLDLVLPYRCGPYILTTLTSYKHVADTTYDVET